jgi:hypothetical protein
MIELKDIWKVIQIGVNIIGWITVTFILIGTVRGIIV